MLQKLLVLISGIIFGLGLTISSMTNPDKVLSFLDVFGSWDPSLIFVMGGAILFTSPLLFFLKKNDNLILANEINLPKKNSIDKSLIIGSLLFGVGWGAVGFCPGPAISSIALLNPYSLIFILSLIAGFYLSNIIKL
ncbi:MAG: hypothetical protein CFH16_00620 [Alphaproteobacteria bacterium MarineAlpha5_Bin6]|nr:MAG: hypothetical protein CFH17_01289 [Alphaproteobacteria bacterium MarineAlpha5_Bin7]PPR54116.1 MAG: hypothetical protein CFH16_00620 [Alphaproteobacteria bacterium MarineAlpha5_Bin6]|tara:strand:- start:609 stop:1019 length:411 start_codon:yes stop_codon:yes gene_type:complete